MFNHRGLFRASHNTYRLGGLRPPSDKRLPPVRLWIWYAGQPVRIQLRAGTCLALHRVETTDEGFDARTIEFEYAVDGISRRDVSDARDCDGRTSYVSNLHTSLDHVRQCARGVEQMVTWTEQTSEVHDRTARVANY